MRRVFAVVGFSSFFISLICIYFGVKFSITLSILSLLLFIAFLIAKATRKLVVFSVLFLAICISALNIYVFDINAERYTEEYCKSGVKLSATLVDYPEVSDNGFKYIFKTDDENKVKFSLLSNDLIDAKPGDTVTGTFDFSNQYNDYSNRIYFSSYIYSAEKMTVKHNNKTTLAILRKKLKQGINDNMTIGRGLTKAIVFGDKSGISNDLYYDLQKCGLLHATATSGLHLTIVTGFVFTLLSLLGVSKRKSSIVGIVFVILYMLAVGFVFSLMRAGIMMILYLLSNLFDREGDALNAIGLSATVLILINPYTVTSCSFLLSVSATLGMILVFGPLNSKISSLKPSKFKTLKKLIFALFATAIQSCVALIFTLPIVYVFFGYFSVAGIFANAILSPFISLILIFGIIVCLFNFIPILPEIIGGANDMVCLVVIKICNFIGKFKYCLVSIDYKSFSIVFLSISIVIAVSILVYYFLKVEKLLVLKISVLLSVNILLLSIFINVAFDTKNVKLKVQNSGSGMCITTVVDNKMIVIETGGKNCKRKVKNEMIGNSSQNIELLIIPNSSDGEYSSAQTITSNFNVNKSLINTDLLDRDKYKIKSNIENICNVNSVKVKNLEIDIIKQETSGAIYLTNGSVSALIINEQFNCERLSEKYKKCDILILSGEIKNNFKNIKTSKAIILSYESFEEQTVAKYFTTYNLINGSIELEFKDKLKLKAV